MCGDDKNDELETKIDSMSDELEKANEMINSTSVENEQRKIAEVRRVPHALRVSS